MVRFMARDVNLNKNKINPGDQHGHQLNRPIPSCGRLSQTPPEGLCILNVPLV